MDITDGHSMHIYPKKHIIFDQTENRRFYEILHYFFQKRSQGLMKVKSS